MIKTPPIEIMVNPAIVLRQFREEDASAIFALIEQNREHLSQYDDDTSKKYPDIKSVLDSMLSPANPCRLRFGIWRNKTYVGTVNLTPSAMEKSAEIGYYLGEEFQKMGLMTLAVRRLVNYAFEEMRLLEVYASVHKDNSASRAVLERARFRVTGQYADKIVLRISA